MSYSSIRKQNSGKPFKIEHGPEGNRIKEEPRFMITVDGKFKSLFIGDNTVLATVPIDTPMETLWNEAFTNVKYIKINKE